MKFFVSHKKEDTYQAQLVALRLRKNGADVYLDALDPSGKDGPRLADYLREMLSSCTDLIAVVSAQTRDSWWVPWEIGVANERDYPLATYAAGRCDLLSFLIKWPYLRTQVELDTYVRVRKQTDHSLSYAKTAAGYKAKYAKLFYTNLRSDLVSKLKKYIR